MAKELEWIKKAPKIELHVHLDGAFDPQILFEAAQQLIEELPEEVETPWSGSKMRVREKVQETLHSVDAFKEMISTPSRVGGLASILDCFECFFPLVRGRKEVLQRLTAAFCKSQADQNIIYTEVRYAPHLLCKEGSTLPDPETVVQVVTEEISAALKARPKYHLNQILCCVNLSPEWSEEVCQLGQKYHGQHGGVVGIDIACGEDHFSDDKTFQVHRAALKKAKSSGLGLTVHAGENGAGENVVLAAFEYQADRIGHGYHILEQTDSLPKFKPEAGGLHAPVHFEVCPSSSIASGSVPNPHTTGWDDPDHPLRRLISEDGLSVSISTDDPTIFSCTLASELTLVVEKLGVTKEQIWAMMSNAVNFSWAASSHKQDMEIQLLEYFEALLADAGKVEAPDA